MRAIDASKRQLDVKLSSLEKDKQPHSHLAVGFPFHNQMIQSTFFGSPPKSLSRVMHWPRWCCVCIATWTSASAIVIRQGGSGNHGICTLRDKVSPSSVAAKSRKPAWTDSARAFKSAKVGGGPPGGPPSGSPCNTDRNPC